MAIESIDCWSKKAITYGRLRQRVKAGQVIAILDSRDRLQAALAEAQATLARINLTNKQLLNQAQTKLQRINASGQQQVAAAQATLAQIREVRPVDVQAAQAEVDRTIANAQEAQASLDQAVVKAPQAREIL